MLELGKGFPTIKFRAKNWIERMKRSSVFLLFAIILFLLSSLITITQGGKILQDWYYETLGRQSKVLKDVKLLAPGMSIDYFISKLGSPIFINSENLTLEQKGGPVTEKSYVFDLRPLFVVASVDKEGKVLAYSVTSPDSSVNPSLTLPNEYGEVVLGKTRFSDLDEVTGGPFSIAGNCGARRISYDEQYYYGNPGNYQYYIFSFNDMGLSTGLWKVNGTNLEPSEAQGVTQLCDLSDDGLLVPTELSSDIGWDCKDCNLKTDKVRKVRQEIINTYTVTAPFVDSSQLGKRYGHDSDQMRILPW
jgi:hypothetical protein